MKKLDTNFLLMFFPFSAFIEYLLLAKYFAFIELLHPLI